MISKFRPLTIITTELFPRWSVCWEFSTDSHSEFSQLFNEIDSRLILQKTEFAQLNLNSGLKNFRVHVL